MNADTITLLRLAQEGDNNACERLLTENSGLIWSVARRYFGRGVDADDLYQLGCLGFIKAVRGFDSSYGTQFSTYAVPKIAGEIRRFLRDDGSIKVSRSIKERSQTIKTTRSRLSHSLGREPTVSELCAETGISIEDIAVAETATSATDSIQREAGEDGFTLESILGGASIEDDLLEKLSLREAIAALPEKERLVISLRYFRGMTQDKAAKVLGVSQVQISRLERRAVDMLKKVI